MKLNIPADEIRKRLGIIVKLTRTARKLSQRKLAKACGISQNKIFQLENGRGSFEMLDLFQIAATLDIEPSYIVSAVFRPITEVSMKLTVEPQELESDDVAGIG